MGSSGLENDTIAHIGEASLPGKGREGRLLGVRGYHQLRLQLATSTHTPLRVYMFHHPSRSQSGNEYSMYREIQAVVVVVVGTDITC